MDLLVFYYFSECVFDFKILGSGEDAVPFENVEDEDDSEDDETFEFVSPYNKKGKGVAKELKAKVRTGTAFWFCLTLLQCYFMTDLMLPRDSDYASGSGKPLQKWTNVDCHGKVIPGAGLASMRRTKPLRINELNRGKEFLIETSEEDTGEDETFEFMQGYKNRAGFGKPCQKRRKVDCCGKEVARAELAPEPKNAYTTTKMKPLRMNEMDKRKGILKESSEEEDPEDSEDESFEFISSDEFKGCDDAKKMKSKVRDANTAGTSTKPRRKRISVDWLGRDIFEQKLAPMPLGTYFVTTMKPKRMNELYIPKDLVNDENLHLPKILKLVDPSERIYSARLVKWTDGRTFYKGGWNRLLRINGISKDDYLICEFGEGDARNCLHITFLLLNK